MAERIKVWDLAVRLFHWSLVVAFVAAYLTGEDESPNHVYLGYFIGGLIGFRLIWGFVGGRYARFRAFLYSPAETLGYVRATLAGKSRHYLSHNPLGALMVFALLLSLTGTVLTGLALNGDLPGVSAAASEQSERGYANSNSEDGDDDDEHEAGDAQTSSTESAAHAAHEQWEEIHEFFAQLCLVLIGLHIVGVIAASLLHKEKLVPAMITGWKDQPQSPD